MPTEAPTTHVEGGKRKRLDDDNVAKTPEAWNFKAWQQDPGRYLLSNLAGPVEWAYQRSKFRRADEVSDGRPGVYEWLAEGERMERAGEWTGEEFEIASKGMGIARKQNKSYRKDDGTVLSGILAQGTKALVRAPAEGKEESADAMKRLGFLLGRKTRVSAEELSAWRDKYVKPDTTKEEKIALMTRLLKDKYTLGTKYADALLATGDKVLHESAGRRAPSLWEYKELSEATLAAHPEYSKGGDMLGRLLMARRDELRREEKEVEEARLRAGAAAPRRSD